MHLDGLWLKKVMNGNVLQLFFITLLMSLLTRSSLWSLDRCMCMCNIFPIIVFT